MTKIGSLLYSLCSESYEEMQELMTYIDTACLTCDVLRCEELFSLLDIKCPDTLKDYGWPNPIAYQNDEYFYLYAVLNNVNDGQIWHIKCPEPKKLN